MPPKQHLLLVKVPPGSNEEAVFEQLLETLYETMTNASVAFEVASIHQHIYFYVRVSAKIRAIVEGQIYAQYPDAEIFAVKDYARPAVLAKDKGFACSDVILERSDIYPIKTHRQFEGDSLSGIFSVLSKAAEGEEIWIQVVGKPAPEDWKLSFGRRFKMRVLGFKNVFRLRDYLKLKGKTALRASEKEEFNKKADKHSYHVCIRIAYVAPQQETAHNKIESIKRAFQQFNTTDFNSMKGVRSNKNSFLQKYASGSLDNPFLFTTEELATVYHYPQPDEVPHIVHVVSRKKEPPESLPKEGTVAPQDLSVFGSTNYHNQSIKFGIKRIDRRRHLYVVGKSGTGKSKMLELLIAEDLKAGKGVGVLDPHGDLIDKISSNMFPRSALRM